LLPWLSGTPGMGRGRWWYVSSTTVIDNNNVAMYIENYLSQISSNLKVRLIEEFANCFYVVV